MLFEAIKNGEIIIVVDDDNRENEGDFLAACRKNYSRNDKLYGNPWRGLICAPLTEKRCRRIETCIEWLTTIPTQWKLLLRFRRFKRKWSYYWYFCS